MPKKVQWIEISGYDGNVISLVVDGVQYAVTDQHPYYQQILNAARADDDKAVSHFIDIGQAIEARFVPLTEQVTVRGRKVYFDNDEADTSLTQAIVRFLRNDDEDSARALAIFFEKLAANPSENSKKMLYDWMRNRHFSILSNGNLVAYKSVKRELDKKGNATLVSVSSGKAIVNGEELDAGNVPNEVASLIEVPRSYVDDNINVACSHGLHAGTYRYAKGFSGNAMLAVAINPRDVVSVPNDGSEKIRCCRYLVLGEVTSEKDTEDVVDDDIFLIELDESLQSQYKKNAKEQDEQVGPERWFSDEPTDEEPSKAQTEGWLGKVKKSW